jgi:hypothetical protein
MTFFVFLPTATRTGIVATDFVIIDGLLLTVIGAIAAHELQLGELSFLLPLNIAGEVLNRGLRRGPLLLSRLNDVLFLGFLFVIVLREW